MDHRNPWIPVAVAALLAAACLTAGPAAADERSDRRQDERQAERNHGWDGRQWDQHRYPDYYEQRPDVYYHAPPVIYEPPAYYGPSGASLNLNFPLFR